MCNYSQFLVQKGKAEGEAKGRAEGREEGREEQKIKDKLDFLEELEADHCSDERILKFLRINTEQLKSLREMLQEKRAAVTRLNWLSRNHGFSCPSPTQNAM